MKTTFPASSLPKSITAWAATAKQPEPEPKPITARQIINEALAMIESEPLALNKMPMVYRKVSNYVDGLYIYHLTAEEMNQSAIIVRPLP